jgi:hypothetical protein
MQSPLSASKPISRGRSFLGLWVATTTVGWAFGFVPSILLITGALYSETDSNPNLVEKLLILACMALLLLGISGAIVGMGQALALSNRTGQQWAEGWFVFTLLGTAIGWILGWMASIWTFVISPSDGLETWLLSGLVTGACIGLSVGIAQWFLLRSVTLNSGWWFIISTASWGGAAIVYWLVYHLSGGPFEAVVTYSSDAFSTKSFDAYSAWPAMLAGWLIGGLLLGSVTGLAMKRLLSRAERLTVE